MKEQTKHKILEAAKKLFAEKGFNGTSTRKIASLAEVNLAGLHYHFQNKHTLYEEVVRAIHSEINLLLESVKKKNNNSPQKFAQNILKIALGNKKYFDMFKIFLLGTQEAVNIIHSTETAKEGNLDAVMVQCLKEEFGEKIKDEDAYFAARVIFSFIEQSLLKYHLTTGTKISIKKETLITYLNRLIKITLADIVK